MEIEGEKSTIGLLRFELQFNLEVIIGKGVNHLTLEFDPSIIECKKTIANCNISGLFELNGLNFDRAVWSFIIITRVK